ncbi:MAG: type III-B CRISPR module-associated Cmr3 family protein [Bacteroidota bacterium]
MSVKPYLITFKPFGRYYFGTSRSFAEGFYAVSQKFPTQTTILGCLRYTLLLQNGFDSKLNPKQQDLTKFYDLTGKSKMASLLVENDDDFGVICKISPVFIVERDKSGTIQDFLLQLPSDVVLRGNSIQRKTFEAIFDTKNNSNKTNLNISYKKAFSDKDYTCDNKMGGKNFWNNYSKNSTSNPIEEEKIFINDKQPGLGRNENRVAEESKFYIKKDFRLRKNYSFGVIVHIDDEKIAINNTESSKKWKLHNDDAKLGGENCWFRMKIISTEDFQFDHPIIDRFFDVGDFGDFENLPVTDANKKMVFISPLIGSGELKYQHGIVNNVYSVRIWISGSKKTDSFMSIPQGSVIYGEIKRNGFKSFRKKIGFNWAIQV